MPRAWARRVVRASSFGSFVLLAAVGLGGCAQGSTLDDSNVALEGAALNEAQGAEVAEAVVVADAEAAAAAVVGEDEVRIPMAAASRLRGLGAGAVFVSARGPSGSKNPEGFLRRVVSASEERGVLVVRTAKAALTDAVVRGDLRTGPFGVSFDHEGEAEALAAAPKTTIAPISLDLGDTMLFENTDEIEGASGPVHFKETIRIDRGKITSQPDVDVDLRIKGGKVSRFAAKVEGSLDAELVATARVEADGPVDAAVLARLRAKKHHVRKVLHTGRRIPLPTLSVGRVPVSPSVQVTIALVCDLSFGGAHVARAGVQARSQVRLAASYEDGVWGPPSASSFSIKPAFQIAQPGEVEARCALESSAELAAYGVGGVTMTVSPWVSYDVARDGAGYRYRAEAGATGTMRGSADVFGVRPEDLERTLSTWASESPVTGTTN